MITGYPVVRFAHLLGVIPQVNDSIRPWESSGRFVWQKVRGRPARRCA